MTRQVHLPSKELVTRAIRFQNPERIPLMFRTDPDRSDIVQVGFSDPVGWVADSKGEDEWGCLWDNLIGTGIGQVINHPLASWEDLPRYSFPNPHVESRFGDIEAALRKYPEKYIAGAMGLPMNPGELNRYRSAGGSSIVEGTKNLKQVLFGFTSLMWWTLTVAPRAAICRLNSSATCAPLPYFEA